MYAYSQNIPYKISSKLTYDPNEYYFDKIDKKILDYNIHIFQNGHYECIITDDDLDGFMEVLKDKTFTLNGKEYHGFYLEPWYISFLRDGVLPFHQ